MTIEKPQYAGAYLRKTGELVGTRSPYDVTGQPMKSSAYMEEPFILLIGDNLPQKITIGSGSETIPATAEHEAYTVQYDTVNGVRYRPYMVVPNA